MNLALTPFNLRLKSALVTAHGPIAERHGLVVQVHGSDGVSGFGEATPMVEFGTESLAACESALRSIPAFDEPDSLAAVTALADRLRSTPSARHGLELALLDVLGKRIELPLARLLTETPAATVRCNALLEGHDEATVALSASLAIHRGYTTLKMKVGARPLADDIRRLRAVRDVVGPAATLRIDANGAWSLDEARMALNAFGAFGIELCEQPVPAERIDWLRALRGAVPCLIAADETLQVPRIDSTLFAPSPAADVLVLKPMALGGLLPAYQLATIAAKHGIGSYVTTFIDGPYARAGAAHLAAALPDQSLDHGLATADLFIDPFIDAFTPRNGVITLPDAAGLGVS